MNCYSPKANNATPRKNMSGRIWRALVLGGLLALTLGCQGFGFGNAVQREILAQPALVKPDDLQPRFVINEDDDGEHLVLDVNIEHTAALEAELAADGLDAASALFLGFGRRPVPPTLRRLIPVGAPIDETKATLTDLGFHWKDHDLGEPDAGFLVGRAFVWDATWAKPARWLDGHQLSLEVVYRYGKVMRVSVWANEQELHDHLSQAITSEWEEALGSSNRRQEEFAAACAKRPVPCARIELAENEAAEFYHQADAIIRITYRESDPSSIDRPQFLTNFVGRTGKRSCRRTTRQLVVGMPVRDAETWLREYGFCCSGLDRGKAAAVPLNRHRFASRETWLEPDRAAELSEIELEVDSDRGLVTGLGLRFNDNPLTDLVQSQKPDGNEKPPAPQCPGREVVEQR
jgi:hypothetical protein